MFSGRSFKQLKAEYGAISEAKESMIIIWARLFFNSSMRFATFWK